MQKFVPLGLLAILAGCTTTTGQIEASKDVQAKGCLCAGNQCSTLVSASGEAAVQSAASGSFRDTTIGRQNEAPPVAKPKRR